MENKNFRVFFFCIICISSINMYVKLIYIVRGMEDM